MLMPIIKMPGGKTDDEKFEDAKRFLPILIVRFPDHGDFQLHDIITKFTDADPADRKAMIDCQNQLKRILDDNDYVRQGTFNLQLQLTDNGRAEKKRLIEEADIEKRKSEVSPEQFSFSDYMNVTIELLQNQTMPLTHALIWHELKSNYPHVSLHEVIAELIRLDLTKTGFDTKGKETYLLRQPIKKQIENLPGIFIGKPYEFFLAEEERKHNESVEKHNLELQKLRDEVLDYREKWEREKRQYKIALAAAIIEAIGLVLSLWLK